MTQHSVFAPHLGRHVKFGRKRPIATRQTHPHLFKAADEYLVTLPTPPASVDYYSACKQALSDILGNDTLGDCTATGACHFDESITASADSPVVFTREQAIAFYSLSTGYNPADPNTDQGGDEITVLTTWRDKGLDGKGTHAIKGWLSVDPTNVQLVKTCCWLFGGLYFGVELPDTWTNPFPSGDGFTWDIGTPDMNQGHCFVGLGYNDQGVQIDTWGLIGTVTYAAVAKLCAESAYGNLFAILTDEIIDKAKGLAPSGFNWDQLLADFDGSGGNAPKPPPPAPPPPAPTSAPTCAQAQAAVTAALNHGHPMMTRAQAVKIASDALTPLWPVGK